jgi:Rod binding domain-containing protein
MTLVVAAMAVSGQSAPQATPQPRLVRAAHEFEAQMMQEILKPMTSGNGLDGEDGSASGSGSSLAEFASEALGRALSEQGGFGIADGIVRELSHSGVGPITAQGTGDLQGNTTMKTIK